MKIEKTNSPPLASLTGEAAYAPAARQSDSKANTAVDADATSVNLGSTSTQLRNLENSLASAPLVDADKVNQIKQAISEGRFQVNSGAIADRLISTVQDLITASKH